MKRKLTPVKAERKVLKIVKGTNGIDTTKTDKMAKWVKDKLTGKKNPPRLMAYGEFVDLVQQKRKVLRRELRR